LIASSRRRTVRKPPNDLGKIGFAEFNPQKFLGQGQR
jgi:hypothetical protein